MRLRRLGPMAGLILLVAGCSEPPQNEMNQARGAIAAARAAGAETYAPAALDEARAALAESERAVEQRDYRLALRYALVTARQRLAAARAARVRPRDLAGPRRTIGAAAAVLQESRTALDGEQYARIERSLEETTRRLQAAAQELDRAIAARTARRRR
jgi:hypothetical protein